MNSHLTDLQPYPFERLRALFAGVTPPALAPIRLSIGEPQHATPAFIGEALVRHLDGLSVYPTTAGLDRLREAIADWFGRRYGLPRLDPATQVLPVNGTREALFAFAQAVVDPAATSGGAPVVVCPNPFYQIYEGAARPCGGATPRSSTRRPPTASASISSHAVGCGVAADAARCTSVRRAIRPAAC